ncbi:helix-turn-helix domain-containing protein [Nesterenkonia alkaliphila]|uniref:Bacteriophage CI repressor N-terminal domain-containing protein n=1 Tax=Nesterenkonia alkaliphila TaxID=1463631 RepID=A0A7K1UGZ4_9MICC|nr:helix-turn-helix transcriptional regulator [Nesterenkonia alkaliphila]MVT25709.1 hypothetical protein [Nesterenkonia alkaliphila]GFZ85266.1 hypothetical protein GCM10011359_12960 [Nesterenkonia alkaliphila]
MTYLEQLRSNIGAEIGRRGLTYQAAAEALGISKGTFSAKLHGRVQRSSRASFRLDELMRLARWLGVPFSTLVAGFDEAELLEDELVSAS